jgi:SAM-dependent methyltransferase
MTERSWKQVWAERTLDPGRLSPLSKLMAADGLDTKFGAVSEESWCEFVRATAKSAGIGANDTIFEVGCGAGAWLYDFYERGQRVGGIDASAALVSYAREFMPDGTWTVGDALEVEAVTRYDFVVSCGVFIYFDSLDYAAAVLAKMSGKAEKGVLILDIPDSEKREQAIAFRQGSLGAAEYRERYDGLDHFYYDKGWFEAVLRGLGFGHISIEDQKVAGYKNSEFRFNAIALR